MFRIFVHWRRTIIISCVIDVVFVVLWVILLVYATESKEFFLILFVFGAAPFFSLALYVHSFFRSINRLESNQSVIYFVGLCAHLLR